MTIRQICQAVRAILHQYDIRPTVKYVNTKRNIIDGATRTDLCQRFFKALWASGAEEYQGPPMNSVHMWQKLGPILNKVGAIKVKLSALSSEPTSKRNGQVSFDGTNKRQTTIRKR